MEERIDLVPALDISSWNGRWPIGDLPRERISGDRELDLRFVPARGAGDGPGVGTDAGTGAEGTPDAGGGDTCATY